MRNPCLETTTRACIHWLAVKCAGILCSDMSRKTIPSISRHFYFLFFFTSTASSTTTPPLCPSLHCMADQFSHFSLSSRHSQDGQLQHMDVPNGLAMQSSVVKRSWKYRQEECSFIQRP